MKSLHRRDVFHVLLLFTITTISFAKELPSNLPVQHSPETIPGLILTDSISSNSSLPLNNTSAESSEEVIARKPPAVKFANADGKLVDEEMSPEEFTDQQNKISRRESEAQEELLRQEEERRQLRSFCFHVPEEFCEFQNFTAELPKDKVSKNLCPCKPHPFIEHSIICCNVTDIEYANKCFNNQFKHSNPKQIHIRNATLASLKLNITWWKSFDRIAVTDGKIDKISHAFGIMTKLTCFNVSNNNIGEINARAFKHVQPMNFTVLDLSANNLKLVPNLTETMYPSLQVDIRDNNGMRCNKLQDQVNIGMNFAERNQSKCESSRGFHWFNATDFMHLSQLYLNRDIQNKCPAGCTCAIFRVSYEEDVSINTVRVDCSNKNLLEIPSSLPPNTVMLNVSNNNITNLRGLNLHYHLTMLYADNNPISSLLDLEGTGFKDDFTLLSLKNNKLKQIPIYLLTKTLDKSPMGKVLYFAGNELNCDCNSATELRIWLLSHQNSVKDYDLIKCENLPDTVIHLQESKLCQSKHDAMDYIFYLIAAEVLLLLALILKVSYDYYVFKTQSYLPWPANKMPKLPCDWLCES